MDIPVSRLNNRMALHTPAEFPLGLVFVVGQVQDLEWPLQNRGEVRFSLVEPGYRLRCRLMARKARQVQFEEGQLVRATGHLAFDPTRVDYYLAARDLEVIPEARQAPPADARPILAEMQQRAKEANLAPAQLPGWVKELAPPEFRDALPATPPEPAQVEEAAEVEQATAGDNGHATTETAVPPGSLSPQLTEFLLKAIDADEDVELTPELIAEYEPRARRGKTAFKAAYPHDVIKSPPPERIHWLIAAALIVMVILILALVTYLAINAL
jgi:hypothetical protein